MGRALKILLGTLGSIIGIVGVLFASLYFSELPQEVVKIVVEREMTKIFKKEVRIGSITGNLLSSASLNNIRIAEKDTIKNGEMIHIHKLIAFYDLKKGFKVRWDMSAASSKVHIEGMDIYLTRDLKERWNLLHIFPPPEPGVTPNPPTFKGVMTIDGLTIHYKDLKGWGKDVLEQPFEDSFEKMKVTIDFADLIKSPLIFDGITKSSGNPVSFEGLFNTLNGQFDILLKAQPDILLWGPYVFPHDGYLISGKDPFISGHIFSKQPFPSDKIGFYYDLSVKFDDGEFEMPFFPTSLQNIEADLKFLHGYVSKSSFKDLIPDDQLLEKLWIFLLDTELVSSSGMLVKWRDRLFDYNSVPFPSYLQDYRSDLIKKLEDAPAQIYIPKLKGSISDIPLTGEGVLYLSEGKMAINVETKNASKKSFKIENLKGMFPAMKNWKFSGTGQSSFSIVGDLSNPKVVGDFEIGNAKVYGFYPSGLEMAFNFFEKNLHMNLNKGQLYSGPIFGDVDIQFNDTAPKLKARLKGRRQNFDKIFKKPYPHSTGHFNFQLNLDGITTRYLGHLKVNSYQKQFKILNQHVNKVDIPFSVDDYVQIGIMDSSIFVNADNVSTIENPIIDLNAPTPSKGSFFSAFDRNESVFRFNGDIKNMKHVSLDFSGDMGIVDPDYHLPMSSVGYVSTKGTLSTELVDDFWSHPLDHIKTNVAGRIYDMQVSAIDSLKGNYVFSYDKGLLDVSSLSLNNDVFSMNLAGAWTKNDVHKIRVGLSGLELSELAFFQRKIPEKWKPFNGELQLDLSVDKNSLFGDLFKDLGDSFEDDLFKRLQGFKSFAKLNLTDGAIQGEPIKSVDIVSNWDDQGIRINFGEIVKESSLILLDGDIRFDKSFEINLKEGTRVELDDFAVVLSSYGDFQGNLNLDGVVKGKKGGYNFDLDLNGADLKSHFFELEKLGGKLSYIDGKIKADSLVGDYKGNSYLFDGFVDLAPFMSEIDPVFSDLNYDFKISVENGKVSSVSSLGESIYKEIKIRQGSPIRDDNSLFKSSWINRKSAQSSGQKKPKKSGSKFNLSFPDSDDKRVTLYREGASFSRLSFYETIYEKHKEIEGQKELLLKDLFGGVLSGFVEAKSFKDSYPDINAEFGFEDANVSFIFGKSIDLNLNANHQSRPWKIDAGLVLNDGSVNGVPFQRLEFNGDVNDSGILNLSSSLIKSKIGENKDFILGAIPLSFYWTSEDENLDIDLHLESPGSEFIAAMSPSIKRFNNQGVIDFSIKGTLSTPNMTSSQLNMKNASVWMSDETIFRTPFIFSSNEVRLIDNKVIVPSSSIKWKGEDTKVRLGETENELVVSGSVNIKGLSFVGLENIQFDLDVDSEDSTLFMSYPTLYVGQMDIEGLKLKGVYDVPFSPLLRKTYKENLRTVNEKGPKISANIGLLNGEIILPTLGKRTMKPSFILDVHADLKENLTLEGGLFGDGFLQGVANTFSLDIQKTIEPLLISGAINAPFIKGDVGIIEGQVNFINRIFDVLPYEDQKQFFKEEKEKIAPNTVSFLTKKLDNSEKLKLLPQFDFNGVTVIEPSTANITETTAVLIKIDGSVLDLGNFLFEEYVLTSPDTSRWDAVYKKSYSLLGDDSQGQDAEFIAILKLLMPEIFDNPEVNEQGINSPESQRLIKEIGANRINAIIKREFLRKFEKDLAKSIGLEDISFEYNVGEAIFDSISGDETSTGSGFGINFVAQYFDRLKLRVKTDLDVSEEDRSLFTEQSLSEVELTFLILRNLALIYSNTQDENERKSKTSLEFSHEF
ncbi:hypothetical protein HOG98_03750 [bacterium]|nr:hypothetical protein [bacterium]